MTEEEAKKECERLRAEVKALQREMLARAVEGGRLAGGASRQEKEDAAPGASKPGERGGE